MIDLRCFEITDGGSSWIIRCRRCGAGWFQEKGECSNADAVIEHAMTHQLLTSRAEELRARLTAVGGAIAQVLTEISARMAAPADRSPHVRELRTYLAWSRAMRRELSILSGGCRDQAGLSAVVGAAAAEGMVAPPDPVPTIPLRA